MSSSGDLGDGPSWLAYEDKRCPKCGDLTSIKVSHSLKNPNKLYHWCNTHQFVDWCLPTNAEISPTYHGITESKWNKDIDYLKVSIGNGYCALRTSCNANSIPAKVFVAILVLVFFVVTVKYM